MADDFKRLWYASPDLSRQPDDREVKIGSSLQLLVAFTCLSVQIHTWIAPSLPPQLSWYVLTGDLCLTQPALSAIAFVGSLGRNASRRRTMYGV